MSGSESPRSQQTDQSSENPPDQRDSAGFFSPKKHDERAPAYLQRREWEEAMKRGYAVPFLQLVTLARRSSAMPPLFSKNRSWNR